MCVCLSPADLGILVVLNLECTSNYVQSSKMSELQLLKLNTPYYTENEVILPWLAQILLLSVPLLF